MGSTWPVGMDTLAVTGVLDILETAMNLVILPPFYYGAAATRSSRPKATAPLHVDAKAWRPFAKAMFHGPVRMASATSTCDIHHNGNFVVRNADGSRVQVRRRQAIVAFLEKERGEGWWGNEKMADYYAQQLAGRRSVQLDQGASREDGRAMNGYPFDHAGEGETSAP